jgi:hypothetical protein
MGCSAWPLRSLSPSSPAGIITNSNVAAGQRPHWVGFCVAIVFVLGGMALIVSFAVAGGVGPDG